MQPLTAVPSRTERVYATIRDSICDCTLEPGTHLVQEDLASTLGVSRQPIQQAMLLLKNEGLVVEHGGRGLYVAPLDPEAITHHYQIRVVLDQLAAKLVAERANQSDDFRAALRKRGEEILVAGEAAQRDGTPVEAVHHDLQFHSFLYEMSGNPSIAPTAEAHWNFLRRVMVAVLIHANRGELVWRQHRDILDALIAGNAEAGQRLLSDHAFGAEGALRSEIAAGRATALVGDQGAPRKDLPKQGT